MIFASRQRVVFIGDSITSAQRETFPPHGDGYVSLVWAWVTAARPEVRLEWFNRGVGGHTIRDLAARWETDVVALRPDWLSVMIGIGVYRALPAGRRHRPDRPGTGRAPAPRARPANLARRCQQGRLSSRP